MTQITNQGPNVILDVRFMGGFDCRIGDKTLDTFTNISSKSDHLLVYLLYFHPEGAKKSDVKELLYGDTECDPENSLKALLFRLRKAFSAETGISEKQVISLRSSMLTISPQIEIRSDAAMFRSLYAEAKNEMNEDKLIEILQKAFECYSGEFLPALSTESWVMHEDSMLRSMYSSVVDRLCAKLNARGRYEEVYKVYKRALTYYPFEESWMIGIIDALLETGEYRKAISEYEEFSNLLFDELGVYPSEQLLETIRNVSDRMSMSITNAEAVSRNLIEADMRGAFYCNYPSFVDSYRLLRRIMERDNIKVTLVLLTLMDKKGNILEDKKEAVNAMAVLRMAISVTLRKSDMFTRFFHSQILLMLWNTPESNVPRVIERLSESINYSDTAKICRLRYEVVGDSVPPRSQDYEAMRRLNPWRR